MSRHFHESDLAALNDREPAARAPMLDHLADCPVCRQRVTFARGVQAAAAEATALDPPADALERILARRASGERVILPVVDAIQPPKRRWPLRVAAAAIALFAVGVAAQLILRRARSDSGVPAVVKAPSADPAAPGGVAIFPNQDPTDVRLEASPGVRIEIRLHEGAELGVRGLGTATDAGFRATGTGISVTGLAGGVIEIRVPQTGLTTRVFVNGRLEVTSDGTSLGIASSGSRRDRVTLVVGR
jgi:hypothetical protein